MLQPLEAATKEIGSDNYTTISLVIPIAFNLYNKVVDIVSESDMSNILKDALTVEIEKRFFPAEQVYLLQISTLLHPRFKKCILEIR